MNPVNISIVENVVVTINKYKDSRGYPINHAGRYLDTSPGNQWFDIFDVGYPLSAPDLFQDYHFDINYTSNLKSNEFDNDRSFKLFPNPVENVIKIQCNNNLAETTFTSISIYDIRGIKVYENCVDFTGKEYSEVNIDQLSSGVYFVELCNNGSKMYKTKIIKY